jgi:hypothetical protein
MAGRFPSRLERGERRPSVTRARPRFQVFFQTFPNLGLFSSRISKESFGDFKGLHIGANRKRPFPNFLSPAGLEEPVARMPNVWIVEGS